MNISDSIIKCIIESDSLLRVINNPNHILVDFITSIGNSILPADASNDDISSNTTWYNDELAERNMYTDEGVNIINTISNSCNFTDGKKINLHNLHFGIPTGFVVQSDADNSASIAIDYLCIKIFHSALDAIIFFIHNNTLNDELKTMALYTNVIQTIIDKFMLVTGRSDYIVAERYVRVHKNFSGFVKSNFTEYVPFIGDAAYMFVIAHELSHIVLEHNRYQDIDNVKEIKKINYQKEFEADRWAYEKYLLCLPNKEYYQLARYAPILYLRVFEVVEKCYKISIGKQKEDDDNERFDLELVKLVEEKKIFTSTNLYKLHPPLSERADRLEQMIGDSDCGYPCTLANQINEFLKMAVSIFDSLHKVNVIDRRQNPKIKIKKTR